MNDPFELLPEDAEYLDANHFGKWRKVCEGNRKLGLIIEEFPVPKGYFPETSCLMILVPPGYPASPFDMFYFDPPLGKIDGRELGALAFEEHFRRSWQRWSRHYQWTPGEDNLASHVEYVFNELRTGAS